MVVVHPVGNFVVPALKSAKSIRFIHTDQAVLHNLPVHKLEYHKPLTAGNSLDGAGVVLLEPEAVTKEGVFVQNGGRLLAELAAARGIPVYAIATSWHVASEWHAKPNHEKVSGGLLTGVLSEHGIYSHKDFITKVKKDFPWIIKT